MSVKVSGIYRYPVKSFAGIQLHSAELDKRGIVFDRSWVVVDAKNNCLTQRELSKMCLIQTAVAEARDCVTLSLRAPGMLQIDVPVRTDYKRMEVAIWSKPTIADDQGDAVADWLTEFFGVSVRLVKMAGDFTRQVDQNYALRETDQVGFADEFPLLIISEASLQDLNHRLPEPVPMNRFRPNIVVTGCLPFAEDGWKTLSINGLKFDVVKPCARCVITTIEQSTAAVGAEPLRTLAQFRKIGNKLMFGQNVVHHGPGLISLGDTVEILA